MCSATLPHWVGRCAPGRGDTVCAHAPTTTSPASPRSSARRRRGRQPLRSLRRAPSSTRWRCRDLLGGMPARDRRAAHPSARGCRDRVEGRVDRVARHGRDPQVPDEEPGAGRCPAEPRPDTRRPPSDVRGGHLLHPRLRPQREGAVVEAAEGADARMRALRVRRPLRLRPGGARGRCRRGGLVDRVIVAQPRRDALARTEAPQPRPKGDDAGRPRRGKRRSPRPVRR